MEKENEKSLSISSWVHFGDIHVTREELTNYHDLCRIIADVKKHMADRVDFVFLPGDNANEGTETQYEMLRRALEELHPLSWRAIPGDHDYESGNLDLYQKYLNPNLFYEVAHGNIRLIFLNVLDLRPGQRFGMQRDQLDFLAKSLRDAEAAGHRAVIFMHTYPSQLDGPANDAFAELVARYDHLRLVEMGHTHYNEIANDGRIIYAATRSTGQIEEGPVGFSVTCLDGEVVSWKFKELASPWPFVMITTPADRAFLTRCVPPVRTARLEVHAKAWDRGGIVKAWCRLDEGRYHPMQQGKNASIWSASLNVELVEDGEHRLTVWAINEPGEAAQDTINLLFDKAGRFQTPIPQPVDMENRIGAYPEKGIPGTLLGPNLRGHPW